MEPNEIEGLAPNSDTAQAALMQDLATVNQLADEAMGNPQVRRLAMAVRGLCQVVEHLAGEVEVIKSPKPCEGCADGLDQLQGLRESLDRLDDQSEPEHKGALRRALEYAGILPKVGN